LKTFFLSSGAFLVVLIMVLQYTARPATIDGVVDLTWATDDNPTRQEQMALFQQWYKEKYGQPIGIHIDPSNFDQAKIVVQSVAGSGPDLFDYFGPTSLQTYVESGILLDITDAARRGDFALDIFWPALQTTLARNGRQYGVPDNAVDSLLLLREDFLDQLHLQAPQPGWTWKDLVSLGQALTERDAQGHVTRYGLLGINWMDLVLQNGGDFFNPAGTRCILNRPESVAAIQFYSDLRLKYHILASAGEMASMPGSGGYGGGNVSGNPNYLNIFVAGRGAMMEYGRYAYIVINRINEDRKSEGLAPLHFIPLPVLSQKRTAEIVSARCTGINRRSKHPQEALRFLEFLATKTFSDQIDRSADSLTGIPRFATGPTGLTGGRPFLSGCDDPYWISAMQQGCASPSSPFINGNVLNRIFVEEIDRLDSGLQNPGQTAQRMEERINAAITEYLKVRPDLNRHWHDLEASSPTAFHYEK
jgi:ABC-type glycerol-3-phosphate transport system substrate-binding protein